MSPVHGAMAQQSLHLMLQGSQWDDLESVYCAWCMRWLDCPLDGAARILALHMNLVHGVDPGEEEAMVHPPEDGWRSDVA